MEVPSGASSFARIFVLLLLWIGLRSNLARWGGGCLGLVEYLRGVGVWTGEVTYFKGGVGFFVGSLRPGCHVFLLTLVKSPSCSRRLKKQYQQQLRRQQTAIFFH